PLLTCRLDLATDVAHKAEVVTGDPELCAELLQRHHVLGGGRHKCPRTVLAEQPAFIRDSIGVGIEVDSRTKRGRGPRAADAALRQRHREPAVTEVVCRVHQPATGGRDQELLQRALQLEIDRRRRDRKSTRLNSSHVKISYAVFCLKKKKTT